MPSHSKPTTMNKFYLLLLLPLLVFTACKTASKAYDKGDYNQAINLAVKKLQKDPGDGESIAIVKAAYKNASAIHQDKIRILSNGNDVDKYEKIYNEYQQLQRLYEIVRENPSLSRQVKAVDYSEHLTTYREKAADTWYEKGVTDMKEATKLGSRNAYYAFARAEKFRPQDREIQQLKVKAYEAAVVRVVVLPIDSYNSGYGNYGGYGYRNSSYQFRNFEQELVRNLKYSFNNDFVKFYTEYEARSENLQPDETLEIRMGRLEIGRPYDQSHTRNVSKEVVVREIVYKPDSVVKQYGRVSAQVTTTRRTSVSSGELYVTSRDSKGRVLWSDLFRGEHRWQSEFATYRGDERALSPNDRALMNRYDSEMPREEEIYDEILREMQQDMNYRMRSYYNRYF